MELAKCKCEEGTCYGEPIASYKNLSFNDKVDSYEDYLKNKKFCEETRKTLEDNYSYNKQLEDKNTKYLKNLFLSEFVNSEKQIKGLCVHETKFTKEPYYQSYVYIIGVNKDNIGQGGIHASVINLRFSENDDHMDVTICKEDSHYIEYEKLYSCKITNDEFMNIYKSIDFEIMEGFGLNKANDNC